MDELKSIQLIFNIMIDYTKLQQKIPKNYVLIEPITDNDKLSIGELDIKVGRTVNGDVYHEGEQSVRRGYLLKMPDKIEYKEAGTPWINSDRPNVGDIVYMDYLSAKTCDRYVVDGIECYILPFRSLVLSLNPQMDITTVQMLNGNILAQIVLKPRISELEYKDTYYPDRFLIKRVGTPNKEYLDGLIDDESIKVGDVVLTRFRNYQYLEGSYQLRLDGSKYIFFQRKEIIAILQ